MFILNEFKVFIVLMFSVLSFLLVMVSDVRSEPSLDIQLLNASSKGDLDKVKSLLKQGVDINTVYENGDTGLILSSTNGHLEVVEFLIKSGIDIEAVNQRGKTSLMLASQDGNIEIVKLLIKSGADVNAKDENEDTALKWASEYGTLDVLNFLLKSGADVKSKSAYTALQYAVFGRRADYVKALVDAGVNVNRVPVDESSTPLMWASGEGSFDIVKILVTGGADVNLKIKTGYTALMISSVSIEGIGENMDIIRYLVKSGADINVRSNDNTTALMIAAQNGNLAAVSFYISKGTDMNAKNDEGLTALTLAQKTLAGASEDELYYYEGVPSVIEFLKKKGAK